MAPMLDNEKIEYLSISMIYPCIYCMKNVKVVEQNLLKFRLNIVPL